MRPGKRFESARRLSLFRLDKLNIRKKKSFRFIIRQLLTPSRLGMSDSFRYYFERRAATSRFADVKASQSRPLRVRAGERLRD
jgi:hypothetical protein